MSLSCQLLGCIYQPFYLSLMVCHITLQFLCTKTVLSVQTIVQTHLLFFETVGPTRSCDPLYVDLQGCITHKLSAAQQLKISSALPMFVLCPVGWKPTLKIPNPFKAAITCHSQVRDVINHSKFWMMGSRRKEQFVSDAPWKLMQMRCKALNKLDHPTQLTILTVFTP